MVSSRMMVALRVDFDFVTCSKLLLLWLLQDVIRNIWLERIIRIDIIFRSSTSFNLYFVFWPIGNIGLQRVPHIRRATWFVRDVRVQKSTWNQKQDIGRDPNVVQTGVVQIIIRCPAQCYVIGIRDAAMRDSSTAWNYKFIYIYLYM